MNHFTISIIFLSLFNRPLFAQDELGTVTYNIRMPAISEERVLSFINDAVRSALAPGYEGHPSSAREVLMQSAASDDSIEIILRRADFFADLFAQTRAAASWPHFDSADRKNLSDDFSTISAAQVGLDVYLTYGQGADIAAIAEKYAGYRDPRPVERLLRRHLQASGGLSARIPLQALLSPFIRKNLNTFAPHGGPNCVNAALSVGRGRVYTLRIEHPHLEDVLASVNQGGYQPVPAAEGLEVDDLLLYFDQFHRLVHAASYVGDGIVFTKSGAAMLYPYIFQTRAGMEEIFFMDAVFSMSVFRIPREKPHTTETVKDLRAMLYYKKPLRNDLRTTCKSTFNP